MANLKLKPGVITGNALKELFAYCKDVDAALPAVHDLQVLEPSTLAELAREHFRQPRHAVEVVPVLPDQPIHDPPSHGQRHAGEGGYQRLRRVPTKVRHGVHPSSEPAAELLPGGCSRGRSPRV